MSNRGFDNKPLSLSEIGKISVDVSGELTVLGTSSGPFEYFRRMVRLSSARVGDVRPVSIVVALS